MLVVQIGLREAAMTTICRLWQRILVKNDCRLIIGLFGTQLPWQTIQEPGLLINPQLRLRSSGGVWP